MTFAQRRNRLTTHFYERIPVVKRRISARSGVATNTTSDTAQTYATYTPSRQTRAADPYMHAIPSYFGTCLVRLTLQFDEIRIGEVY